MENITISHPVYEFLKRAETKGLIEHHSLSSIPWSKSEITEALEQIHSRSSELSSFEKKSLKLFMTEFELTDRKNAIIIESQSDSNNIFFDDIFSNKEKFIYHYSDSATQVNLRPLVNFDIKYENDEETRNYAIGALGFRLNGTLENRLGYNLQVTNGRLLAGDRDLALEDPYYKKNIKFNDLEDDIDFSESHIRYENGWFFGSIGREYREMGAGLEQRSFISGKSPAFDAITLGVDYKNFNYQFLFGSLMGLAIDQPFTYGFMLEIPEKYISMHRFSVTPSWGEVSFWEGIVYSRGPDLAYLNPFSFFKSLEHSLRDRDNSLMGVDATVRLLDDLQFKSTILIDDVIFEELGNGHFGNKFAINFAAMYALPFSLDAGVEYTRVLPFTYSHYNTKNSYTNDQMMLGSYVPPNSDKFTFQMNWWFGGRYPLTLTASYLQHGKNVYDEEGNLVKNVGGDAFITQTPGDDNYYTFLDGDKIYVFDMNLKFGLELFRGLNIRAIAGYKTISGDVSAYSRLILGVYEF